MRRSSPRGSSSEAAMRSVPCTPAQTSIQDSGRPPPDRPTTMPCVAVEVLTTPGLGDNSYLVSSGAEAAVIDPQRDVVRLLGVAEARGVRIRYVVETHVHNDYVSGAQELRAAVGAERVGNPALTVVDEALFVAHQLDGLAAYPDYYAYLAPINRNGAPVFGDVPIPPPRSADEVDGAMRRGASLVDAREGAAYAAMHAPGSLNVPIAESFGSYVGWLVPFGDEVVLLVPDRRALFDAAAQLFRIGYDRVTGYLEGGIDGWRASGRDVRSYPTMSAQDLVEDVGRGEAGGGIG